MRRNNCCKERNNKEETVICKERERRGLREKIRLTRGVIINRENKQEKLIGKQSVIKRMPLTLII